MAITDTQDTIEMSVVMRFGITNIQGLITGLLNMPVSDQQAVLFALLLAGNVIGKMTDDKDAAMGELVIKSIMTAMMAGKDLGELDDHFNQGGYAGK